MLELMVQIYYHHFNESMNNPSSKRNVLWVTTWPCLLCIRQLNFIRAVHYKVSDTLLQADGRQRCRKKKHLIEAVPFGRLNQMLRTIV